MISCLRSLPLISVRRGRGLYYFSTKMSPCIPFDTQPFPFRRFEPCCPDSSADPASNGYVPCQKHPIPNVLGRKIDMTGEMTGRTPTERHVVMCVGPEGKEWERSKVEAVPGGSVHAIQQCHQSYLRSPAHRNCDAPPSEKDFLLTVCDRTPTKDSLVDTANACDMMVFPEFVLYPKVDPARLAESDVVQVLETLWKDPSSPDLPSIQRETVIKDEDGHEVDAVVLVCTHGRRDMRCGRIGPLIVDEFRELIKERRQQGMTKRVLVYGTSHFGGHKFAGNVIIHQKGLGGQMYGCVRNCHINEIIERHIIKGRVIKELWRGQVTPSTLSSWKL